MSDFRGNYQGEAEARLEKKVKGETAKIETENIPNTGRYDLTMGCGERGNSVLEKNVKMMISC